VTFVQVKRLFIYVTKKLGMLPALTFFLGLHTINKRGLNDMFAIPWIHLLILIIASFRLTHLLVYDEITSFLRKPFIKVTYEENDAGQVVQQIHIKGKGWRHAVGLFLGCHWCVGIWSAFIVVGLYGLCPSIFPLLLVLAVAGAASVLEDKL
jgi:hypothetical protein